MVRVNGETWLSWIDTASRLTASCWRRLERVLVIQNWSETSTFILKRAGGHRISPIRTASNCFGLGYAKNVTGYGRFRCLRATSVHDGSARAGCVPHKGRVYR